MSQNIRLVAFDIDDTILNSQGVLTTCVAHSIQNALERGIAVLPATGRQFSGIPKEILAIPGIRYAITANGARVQDLSTGETLFSDCFSTKQALSVLRLVQTFHAALAAYINGIAYCDNIDFAFLAGAVSPRILHYLQTSREKVEDLYSFIASSPHPVEKFSLCFSDAAERSRAFSALAQRNDNTATSSLNRNLEINTRTANKGSALLALASHLGIAREEVMAIGDSSNDAEMLKAAGCGVAMANAPKEIRALANATTLSCDEGGVAAILNSLPSPF